jgi:hypothetical protein
MAESFEGLKVLDERPEESVLSETEERLRREVEAQGLEAWDEEDVGVQFSRRSSSGIDTRGDLADYIQSCTGFQEVDVVVYASEPRGRGKRELAEPVDARIQLDDETFLRTYEALVDSFEVKKAGFNLTGYGEEAVEAYRTVQPMMAFLLSRGNNDYGATVSHRHGGTVETMWSHEGDNYEVFKALHGEGLAYEGVAMDGEEEAEWLIADHGAEDLYDSR